METRLAMAAPAAITFAQGDGSEDLPFSGA
jgi:hypothetical protein